MEISFSNQLGIGKRLWQPCEVAKRLDKRYPRKARLSVVGIKPTLSQVFRNIRDPQCLTLQMCCVSSADLIIVIS